jgi:FKBP-type peptidyl-prolyl cis-trans isomerase FkpA
MTVTTTVSGLQYDDLRVGSGAPARFGSDVIVHYTGWLIDGRKFDSSRDRNDPFGFSIGQGNVIAGWEEGVAGMRVGGLRKLVIPPELGYGAWGAGDVIPPDATLVFEVELLAVD